MTPEKFLELRRRLQDPTYLMPLEEMKDMARETGIAVEGFARGPSGKPMRTIVAPMFPCTIGELKAMVDNNPASPLTPHIRMAIGSLADNVDTAIKLEHAAQLLGADLKTLQQEAIPRAAAQVERERIATNQEAAFRQGRRPGPRKETTPTR